MPIPSTLLFFFLSITIPLEATARVGFSVELIHRDSPQSPLYNPSDIPSDRIRAAVHRSLTRMNYFRLVSTLDSFNYPFNSKVISNNFEYLMTISVGIPRFKLLAIADTGSDLIWTQCMPCIQCYKQNSPIFDPRSSSSFREISCKSNVCSLLGKRGCGQNPNCEYRYTYGDQSYTNGVLAWETITFDSMNTSIAGVSFPNFAIGCSHESNGNFNAISAGIVGLGRGPLSLISQLGPSIDEKFSYCLVPYSQINSSTTNLLNFGHNALVTGENAVSTPLIPGTPETYYFLWLERISVGNESIPVETAPRQPELGESGNIIIDSGTFLTFIPYNPLQQLKTALLKMISLPRTSDPNGVLELCFKVDRSSDVDLPKITFQFTDAPVVLSTKNTFVKSSTKEILCLAMMSSGIPQPSIFGNLAQQDFHIGYDLVENKLSFAPTECGKP